MGRKVILVEVSKKKIWKWKLLYLIYAVFERFTEPILDFKYFFWLFIEIIYTATTASHNARSLVLLVLLISFIHCQHFEIHSLRYP